MSGRKSKHPSRRDDAIERGAELKIYVDQKVVRAFQGESVAAALLASRGPQALRKTAASGAQRGLYCGIGSCFDCVMVIDGQPGIRTCRTLVQSGMRIESQTGYSAWKIEP